MKFTVQYDLPESAVEAFQTHWNIIARKNLEDITVIGYKIGILTSYQVQQILGFSSRWETETFLHKHQCYLHYDDDDFQHDGDVLQEIMDHRSSPVIQNFRPHSEKGRQTGS
ncbi:UPF0175 family protein [Anaerolineales bacterium HSG25]|nr:UPF0175 family protein [Anaerolineales bacterium HSG25]